MKEKVFADLLSELANVVRKKGAKYALFRLSQITSEDFAQEEFERLKFEVSEHFGIDPSSISEKHNKNDKVYCARVVICFFLSKNTSISQARMSKMLNKDASQISKYIKNALNLDERNPIQRQIKNAIEKIQWHKRQ
jgi:hypothetical protein